MEIIDALRGALSIPVPGERMGPGKPCFYLDTNVIVDLIRNRREDSKKLIDFCKQEDWKCITAYFTHMEIFNIEQDTEYFHLKVNEGLDLDRILRSRYTRDLTKTTLLKIENSVYEGIRRSYDIIKWEYLDEAGWNLAIKYSSQSNISPPDCIHFATAIITDCDVLVTSDSHFSQNAKETIASGPPEQVWANIEKIMRSGNKITT